MPMNWSWRGFFGIIGTFAVIPLIKFFSWLDGGAACPDGGKWPFC